MSQLSFEARNRPAWRQLSEILEALDARRPTPLAAELPALHRRLCQHLALARHRRYGAALIDELNALAMRGYRQLYARRGAGAARVGVWVRAFPCAVRADWPMLLAATLLFGLPALACWLAIRLQPDLVYAVLQPEMVAQLEQMYDPSSAHFLRERPADSDLLMFGFYVRNNVGIAFRTFASGLFGGVGSAFFLTLNGAILGAAAAHLQNLDFGTPFFSFVIGHGSFELTALVLSGAIGMRLGWALVAPGQLSRAVALKQAATRTLPTLYGMAAMLLLAACVEAFWSASTRVGTEVKYAVGAALWALVIAMLALGGRRDAD